MPDNEYLCQIMSIYARGFYSCINLVFLNPNYLLLISETCRYFWFTLYYILLPGIDISRILFRYPLGQ